MLTRSYLLLIAAILLGVAGQLLLKNGMAKRPDFRLSQIFSLVTDPSILGGFLSYGLSTLLYIQSLAKLDLSLAYPTVSLGYVGAVFLSSKFFGEKVGLSRWVAVGIICAGVVLVGL